MPKLSDSLVAAPVIALVYGTSGSGKTSLIGEMAKHEELWPIYIADFDLRIQSLRATLSMDEMSHIYSDYYQDGKFQGTAWMDFEKFANDPKLLDTKYGVTFKTFAMDSLTFAMRAQMARIQMLAGGKSSSTPPTLPEYGAQTSGMLEILTKLRGCGKNIIVTAHEAGNKDDVTGRMFKTLDVTPSLLKTPGLFNEFWHTEISAPPGKEPEFVVRTRGDVTYSARTSFRTLDTLEKQGLVWTKIIKQLAEESKTKEEVK